MTYLHNALGSDVSCSLTWDGRIDREDQRGNVRLVDFIDQCARSLAVFVQVDLQQVSMDSCFASTHLEEQILALLARFKHLVETAARIDRDLSTRSARLYPTFQSTHALDDTRATGSFGEVDLSKGVAELGHSSGADEDWET